MVRGQRCKTCSVRLECPISFQSNDEIRTSNSRRVHLKKGSLVYAAGLPASGLFIVERGSISITADDESGTTRIIRFVGPAGLFGTESILPQQIHRFSAVAREPSDICVVDHYSALGELDCHHILCRSLIASLATLVNDSQLRICETSGVRSRSALKRALVGSLRGMMLDHHGSACTRITQRELAQFLGICEETVSRHLNRSKTISFPPSDKCSRPPIRPLFHSYKAKRAKSPGRI